MFDCVCRVRENIVDPNERPSNERLTARVRTVFQPDLDSSAMAEAPAHRGQDDFGLIVQSNAGYVNSFTILTLTLRVGYNAVDPSKTLQRLVPYFAFKVISSWRRGFLTDARRVLASFRSNRRSLAAYSCHPNFKSRIVNRMSSCSALNYHALPVGQMA